MTVGDLEHARGGLVVDVPIGGREPVAEIRHAGLVREPAELDLPGASPERLVTVVEEILEHVTPAAEIHVPHLGLGLEHGSHHVRQRVVEAHDLLELVEDEGGAAVALCRDPTGKLEQTLDRVVDVLASTRRRERESKPAVAVDLDRRADPQPAEQGSRRARRVDPSATPGRRRSSSRAQPRTAPSSASASGRSTRRARPPPSPAGSHAARATTCRSGEVRERRRPDRTGGHSSAPRAPPRDRRRRRRERARRR